MGKRRIITHGFGRHLELALDLRVGKAGLAQEVYLDPGDKTRTEESFKVAPLGRRELIKFFIHGSPSLIAF